MMVTLIYFRTKNQDEIERIQHEYGLPEKMNINRETICKLDDEKMQRISEECEKGLIEVRIKREEDVMMKSVTVARKTKIVEQKKNIRK